MSLFLLWLLGWCHATSKPQPWLNPAWLKLLHYQKTFNGHKSEADGKAFFHATDGRSNPQAEWEASYQALSETTRRYGRLQLPAACVYVSRKKVMERLLKHTFPAVDCPDYQQWRAGLPVEEASLIFATAYPNNPASMFGHTFLRLRGPKTDETLLDYVVNFAATTGSDGGVEFALWGVFGGYEGHFSLAPYFIKVNEYNHGEARDLWEYPLKLSPDIIDMLLAHLWELEASTHFDYYFFDENCSWQLMRLLEAADPTLELSQQLPFYVIPAETIQLLARQRLLGEPKLRPSLRREHLAQNWPPTERGRRAQEISRLRLRARLQSFSKSEQEQYHQLLLARSQDPLPVKTSGRIEAFHRPDQGHGLRRLALTAGDGFKRVELRLAQHDLLDADVGHEAWSALDVLRVGFEERASRVFLREGVLVDVTSLHPWDGLSWEPSWFLKMGASSPQEYNCQRCLTGNIEGGLGQTWQWERVIMGAFLETRFLGAVPDRSGPWVGSGPRVLIGSEYGPWKLLLMTHQLWGWGTSRTLSRYEGGLSYALNTSWALRGSVMSTRSETHATQLDQAIQLLHYF